jgi:hypothetical protein
MLIGGNQYFDTKRITSTQYISSLKGDLSELDTKVSLAKFFRHNPGLFFEMMTGFQLLPVQEILIRSMFLRDAGVIVASRGFSKSFLISVMSILISVLYPGVSVCLLSANFRGARRILEYSEKLVNGSKSDLLHQCFPNPLKRQNDLYKWTLPNGSEIIALPLNPEGIRGVRASYVLLDEGLNVDKEVQTNVIRPFLTVKQNAVEEMKIRAKEDELIKLGFMTEEDRMVAPRNKFFMFSSASYQFQYLYEVYSGYIENIMSPKEVSKKTPTFFTAKLSYKVLEELPNHAFMDITQINAAKADGGENTDYFLKEYMANFPDLSDGYFNVKKMHDCTVKFGDEPSVQLKGDKDAKYLLAIDPSYSASKSSDLFAMTVYMLAPQERKIFQVHNYAKAGGDIKEHFQYLVYLLTHFNIVAITIDGSGVEFLDGFNESSIAKERNIKLNYLTADLETELDEYQKQLSILKNEYNITSNRIVYRQPFNSNSIRKMNEHLKNQIEGKKVWFASKVPVDEKTVNKNRDIFALFNFKDKDDKNFGIEDFIDDKNYWIDETKSQTALIQVKATPLGTLQFDLPQSIRRSDNPNRPRRDCYTCLLMGNMLATHYYSMVYKPEEEAGTFEPFFIN